VVPIFAFYIPILIVGGPGMRWLVPGCPFLPYQEQWYH
jgi:hypothetical protein